MSKKQHWEGLWPCAISSLAAGRKGLFMSCSYIFFFLYVCANCLHIECCAIRLRNIYSEMSVLTVLKRKVHLILIQALETLLSLSFIIVTSVSEAHLAPVVFEESTSMRVFSGTQDSCKWNTFIRTPRLQEGRERENLADSGLLTGLFREERIKQNQIHCDQTHCLSLGKMWTKSPNFPAL